MAPSSTKFGYEQYRQAAENGAENSDDEDESAIRKVNPLPAYALH